MTAREQKLAWIKSVKIKLRKYEGEITSADEFVALTDFTDALSKLQGVWIQEKVQ